MYAMGAWIGFCAGFTWWLTGCGDEQNEIFIAGDAEGTMIDLSKARELLGWKPTPWP